MDDVDGVDGVVVSLRKAQLALLADLEAKNLIDPHTLPETLEWRLSLGATELKNGGSITAVGIMPCNLNISNQSSDAVAPICFLRCGEDMDVIQKVLKEVMHHTQRQINEDTGLQCHGHRNVIWKQSCDLASWWHMLKQSNNSNRGCCPFCAATHKKYHEVEPWVVNGRQVFRGRERDLVKDTFLEMVKFIQMYGWMGISARRQKF